jgi:hypothetical protein
MNPSIAKPNPIRWIAFAVAMLATGSSIAISVQAGLERGGTSAEQGIWIAVALALLLSAHLIPSIVRGANPVVRIVAILLWLASMASTGYTHGTFFLTAQQHAGEVRAGQVSTPYIARHEASSGETITALLQQQARLQEAMNQTSLLKCAGDCRALTVRRRTLRDRLDSIKGQLDEARRNERADDRQAAERARALARQDEQRNDPVSNRLSAWLGVPVASLDLSVAIFFGWLLESVACFFWSVALSGVRSGGLVASVAANAAAQSVEVEDLPVRHSSIVSNVTLAANDPHLVERDASEESAEIPRIAAPQVIVEVATVAASTERSEAEDEARLRIALSAGSATNSIADITRVLQCSEGRALALRRKIAVTNPRLLIVRTG